MRCRATARMRCRATQSRFHGRDEGGIVVRLLRSTKKRGERVRAHEDAASEPRIERRRAKASALAPHENQGQQGGKGPDALQDVELIRVQEFACSRPAEEPAGKQCNEHPEAKEHRTL